ncbi:ATP-binding protein [Porticoccaceae bacterium]|nr:ATP-binding protein [Porticoccaceae bacterium]
MRLYGGSYWLGSEFEEILDSLTEISKQESWATIRADIDTLSKRSESFKPLPEIDTAEKLGDLIKAIDNIMSTEEEGLSSDEEALNCIGNIKANSDFLANTINYYSIIHILVENLPRFVFFSSFDQEIPYQVPLSDLENYPPIMDFIKVAEIDLEKVRATKDEQLRANLLNGKAAKLTGDFSDYWEQDTIELSARVSGDKFIICVREEGKTIEFRPEQRSKGFQWYLSFYLRLKAESIFEADRNVIILIDEPGLYLHATAQQDVLKVLGSLSNDRVQVLFSTHSPYLLDTKRFDRIRLVCRDKKQGTTIYNKVHAGVDRDSLTPIITAMGFDISKETSLIGNKNVLLEGISDYYFLLGMAEYLKVGDKISGLSFIPGKSASQMHLVASILIGWGQDFVAVVDNDKAGRGAHKDLRELSVDKGKILLTSSLNGGAIEDLFSRDDFVTFVLENHSETEVSGDKKNSQLVNGKLDKVLLAKLVMETIRSGKTSIKFSNETKSNFLGLFERMVSAFDESVKIESIDNATDGDG